MSQHITDLVGADYANHILPFLRSGGVYAGYIAAAVAATAVYSLYDKFTVPRELRHLPSVSFLKTSAAMWRGEAKDVTQKRLYIPAYGDHGILVVKSSSNY
ncbi:hypothetical protein BC938DRAFT_480883 [Jimgerdemannia flammicorona]|uniref:Uncharacterized protein n=1 Tax=Jimgerdemannia flammicorona TaxID=994334 RepID=A0A433QHG4_9FUNG|nr:hypothetical protein BC938DRAFT_480883 [Jimgerdemannia flammicorona]